MEISLNSKSDVLLADLAASLGVISADVIMALVTWQALVAKEKECEFLRASCKEPQKLQELEAECKATANTLYGHYKEIFRAPLLKPNEAVQRILSVLVERLAQDYDDVLAKFLDEGP